MEIEIFLRTQQRFVRPAYKIFYPLPSNHEILSNRFRPHIQFQEFPCAMHLLILKMLKRKSVYHHYYKNFSVRDMPVCIPEETYRKNIDNIPKARSIMQRPCLSQARKYLISYNLCF